MHPTTTTTTASLVATLLSLHLLVNNSPVQCQQQQLHPKRGELTQPLAVPTAQSPLLQSRRRVVTAEGDSGGGNHQTTLPGTSPSPPTKDNNCDDDAHHQDFVNDRVKVTLDCKPNLMRLHLNFTEPFRGVVSVGRSSWDELGGGEAATAKEAKRCSIRGQGSRRYRLDLDHRSCRTTFDSKRGQFSNTLFVRYHPTLETGGDYSKTLLCKFGLTSFSVH